jgi:hypothetical protein
MHATGIAEQIVVFGGKTAIAVLLVAAGGAKLAGLREFGVSVRLFLPGGAPRWLAPYLAGGIAAGELVTGAASLAVPQAAWLNLAVLAICGCFLAVWTAGYARHRGRPCRCFGALSRRGFTAAGIARAAGLVLAALVATIGVPGISVQLGAAWQLALLAGAVLVAGAAFSAATAAAGTRWA